MTTLFQAPIHSRRQIEVLVIGGGTAGIAAAACAARRGCKTLLVEREFSLGGTAVSGLVGPFMTCTDPKGERKLIRGIFEELVNRMIALGGALDPMTIPHCDSHSSWHPNGHRNLTPFSSEALKYAAEELCLEHQVELLYGAQLIGVERDASKRRISEAIFAAKEGLIAVEPQMVIDCTGDGDAAFLAGCPMEKGDPTSGEMQAAGLFFLVDGIDEDIMQQRCDEQGWESMRFEREIAAAVANGEYPIPRRRLGLYKSCDGSWRANITRLPGIDGTSSASLTQAAVEGRKQIFAILRFLRKYVPGAKNARLIQSAASPGIRESRRIKGDFVMTEQSIIDGTIFPDTILLCSNSRDVHIGLTGRYLPQEHIYSLPYRILIPSGVDNLLAAGRNVSCDRAVLSAIRVMPPCFGMGQAAGNAAALAVQSGKPPAQIDIHELQARLRAENVVLEP
ncbi:MAG: FAD-dependent oxidoreductase [Lentisphaerae bacterium]|jgi:hypothetical protein|nr:FAD-dependent oxidoreductase [Lentisphaerota bacterium]